MPKIHQQSSEPSAFTIIEVAASQWGDKTACIDDAGHLSFKQLLQDSLAVAEALQALRLSPLTIVGISSTRARDFLPSLFGSLAVGVVAMPIAPELSDFEQERLLRETGIQWRIVAKQNATPSDLTTAIPGTSLFLQRVLTSTPLAHFASLFPDAAVIRHTSGTTGPSRGVVLSHRAIEERTSVSRDYLGVREGDTVLSPLSISYHFIASALTFIRSGATILDAFGLSPEQTFTMAKSHHSSIIYASPDTYHEFVKLPGAHALPHLRRAVSSSASLLTGTAREFAKIFGISIVQALGIIEVGLPLWNEQPSSDNLSLGRCMPPFKARIVDEKSNALPVGEIGELLVSGPGLFSGYLSSNPAQSAKHTDSWFHTGDAVSQEADGTFKYRGRKSSAIRLGIHTIFPEEIERVIREHTDVSQARVRLKTTADDAPHLIAEIVVKDANTTSLETLRAACSKQLPAHLVPSEWLFVDHIPLTGSGKIVRHNFHTPVDPQPSYVKAEQT